MKLITEYTASNLEVLHEKTKSGKKSLAIEGVFMQADKKNRNGRIYDKDVLEKAVAKYVKEQVSTGRAVGELNHPEGPTINLDKVSHKITDLRFEGSNVVGKASILQTPMGKIVEGLLEGGVRLGVSSRGMGTVQDPSAPEAFVNGIMEGVDWVWNNGVLIAQDIEKLETEIKSASRSERPEVEIRAFKNFLSKLV